MPYVKKLIFVIPYLSALTGFVYFLNPLLASLDVLFAFNLSIIIQIIIMLALLLLSGMFFVIFVTLADDVKIVIPISLLCSIVPALVITNQYNLFLSGGLFLAQVLIYLTLKQKLSSYLTFSANTILSPSIKHFAILILLIVSGVFYLSLSANIKQNGFQLPDSLLDLSINLATQQQPASQNDEEIAQPIPQLTAEQIQLLKKYPNLLEKYGLDPSALDSVTTSTKKTSTQTTSVTSQLIKPILEKQFQDMIKPFENWIAPAFALLFFFTLMSISSLLSLFILPMLWILFWMMEKTGFTKVTTEMREVKKLVV